MAAPECVITGGMHNGQVMSAQRPSSVLILFTRFPQPGRTKTRMIPLLGESGAAHLQEIMTGHTLLRARV